MRGQVVEDTSAIALDVGSFVHKILETKGKSMIECSDPVPKADWMQKLFKTEYDNLKKKYWEDWYIPDKFGVTYDEKFKRFWDNFDDMIIDPVWEPLEMECEFEFVWEDRVRLYGFIDRIDENNKNHELRITDYKTANHCYTGKELHQSQQMFIYLLASVWMYNQIPSDFEYDFVFLGEKRGALEKDYSFEKCMKNLDDTLDLMFELQKSKNYYPTTNPLCHFCEYCKTNPKADMKLKNKCDFHSLWARDNKTFEVNKTYDKETFNAEYEYGANITKNLIW